MSDVNHKLSKDVISLLEILSLASLFMLLFAVLGFKSLYLMRVAIVMGINIILVVALNLSNGFTGIFSLGHVGFMAVGAYVSAILTLPVAAKATNLPDLPAWLAHIQLGFLSALLIAGLVTAIIALLVGFPLMRLSGDYVAVATLGFLVIVHSILINWTRFTRGARTFSGVIQYTNVWWVYIWIVITIYVVWRIVHSSYGRALLAVRDDTIAAQTMGISILKSRLLAFTVSAFLTAIGGGLLAHFLTSFSPSSFYFIATFDYVIMLIIGGLGSISGSIIGAVLVTLFSEFLRNLEQHIQLYGLSQITLAVTLVIIVIFFRSGLMGYREIHWPQLLKLGMGRAKRANDRNRGR
jgi:branched-chain amino acid transport system permease protein